MNQIKNDEKSIDENVWSFMNSLWKGNPDERPGFASIKKSLEELIVLENMLPNKDNVIFYTENSFMSQNTTQPVYNG